LEKEVSFILWGIVGKWGVLQLRGSFYQFSLFGAPRTQIIGLLAKLAQQAGGPKELQETVRPMQCMHS
jgi:hypothetical protein